MTARRRSSLALFASVALALPGLAQNHVPAPSLEVDYVHDTGWVSNAGSAPEVVISFEAEYPGGESLRLHFDEVSLAGDPLAGDGSILRITSHEDGHVQELNAIHVAQWRETSAYFNGSTVQVEVLAWPATGPNRLRLRLLEVGTVPSSYESQCGPVDDRILSNDPRVARVMPITCTGWLIDDCRACFLTAGHCSGGVSVAQFNVPLSDPNGSVNNPSPDDQYPVDPMSMQTNGGQGIGNDWAYFGAFSNSNTGLTAAEAQGATFVLVNPPPVGGNNIRITGHGSDNTPSSHNYVQQTHVGPLVTSNSTTVQYRTDTTGGNSGSPVIWDESGEAVGIHTHAGCSTSGTGQNSGTASTHPGLQAALAAPKGICAAGLRIVAGASVIEAGETTPVRIASTGAIVPGTATLHYRMNGGPFLTLPMTPEPNLEFSAELPAASCGDMPESYFSVEDPACGVLTVPEGAPATTEASIVVNSPPSFADSFEQDQGWTTSSSGAIAGFWERGTPVDDPNWAWDPSSDADGTGKCYLTGNALGATDVDFGSVILTSPVLDLTGGARLVSYQYYLHLSLPDGADRMRTQVSPNSSGSGPWTTLVTHSTSSSDWREFAFTSADVSALGVALTADMLVRFVVIDSGTASEVEAGLDAFRVRALDCLDELGTRYCSPNNPNSTGQSGRIVLFGSDVDADDDLQLAASLLPPTSNIGYFIMGTGTNSFVPSGAGSSICVSPGLKRFVAPIENTSDLAGGFTRDVGTEGTLDSVSAEITAGSTWNFQAWHRDAEAGTSHFTDAVSVTFQ